MASPIPACLPQAGLIQPQALGMRYLARQPILDLRGRLHAYELLFRNGPVDAFSADGETATRIMIDNTVVFGLQELTGGVPAFVNCTASSLTDDIVHILPHRLTVLEVLEDVEPLPDLVAACRRLKARGFRIALDDFVYRPDYEPLLRLADYIKVDYLATRPQDRPGLLAHLRRFPAALLAEKVESQAQYDQARAEGFTLFQGYYFCRPQLMARHKIPANRLVHLNLLRLLQESPLDLHRVAEVVKSEPSIAYRLLRLVNSPVMAISREIRSIPVALVTVGEVAFRRLATLAVASELSSGAPAELLRIALTRARFCEQTATLCSRNSTDQYLLGLFSLLPAMLQVPMEAAVADLALPDDTQQALLGEPNAARCPLQWLELYERGQWQECEAVAHRHHLGEALLRKHYNDAVMWADKVLSAAPAS